MINTYYLRMSWRNNCENYKIECKKCPQLSKKVNSIVNYNFLKKRNI